MVNAIILCVESPINLGEKCPAARLLYGCQDPGKVKFDADSISKELRGVVQEAGFGGDSGNYAVDVILPTGTPNAETLLRGCLDKVGYDIRS